ncbi:cytochrome P450 [Aureobasidium sp. EXF-10728]|nr:cytochrome P450 [Aureobasidium sp. EXF-10728]
MLGQQETTPNQVHQSCQVRKVRSFISKPGTFFTEYVTFVCPYKLISLTRTKWSKQYGPIYQCNLAGTNHVWISSDQIARELLGKRRAIYSDRPHIPALEQDNRTSGQYLPLMSINDKWSRQRNFGRYIMTKSHEQSYNAYPELEAIRLLDALMRSPTKYYNHLESYVARVTSRLAWGSSRPAEELKQRARELLIGVSPDGALGNKIPFVMRLPAFLSPAKAWEARRSKVEVDFLETLQQTIAASMSVEQALSTAEEPKQSWTHQFLKRQASWGFDSSREGAYAVGMHAIAGALTIAAPMQSFCLALCHHPQYQSMLHEEIDRVLGDRLPSSQDIPDMPVLRAFIRETLRWRPPVPTGIPHESTEDDMFDGYHIPKGSVFHPLEWSISRDPSLYPDPDAWNPRRWLDPAFPTYREPLDQFPAITGYSQFGYGKRTCQGQKLTEADLFVGIGSIAWLFSINSDPHEKEPVEGGVEKVDVEGTTNPETVPPPAYATGQTAPTREDAQRHDPTMLFSGLLIAKPLPFKFELKIRSRARAQKVSEAWLQHFMAGDYEDK